MGPPHPTLSPSGGEGKGEGVGQEKMLIEYWNDDVRA